MDITITETLQYIVNLKTNTYSKRIWKISGSCVVDGGVFAAPTFTIEDTLNCEDLRKQAVEEILDVLYGQSRESKIIAFKQT